MWHGKVDADGNRAAAGELRIPPATTPKAVKNF